MFVFESNQKYMAVQTEKTKAKQKRNSDIKKHYEELMRDPESQRFAVYEMLAYKYGISATSIGRIVGNIKPSKNAT